VITKEEIINKPSEWILTRRGHFIRIKDSQKVVDPNLARIRQHLQVPYQGKTRFQGKSPEQIAKERYDKVLEEVNFDYQKFHDWLYDIKNQAKVEIVKLTGLEYEEAVKKIFEHIENSKRKWRWRREKEIFLVNEETGQVIYSDFPSHNLFFWDLMFREGREEVLIPLSKEIESKEKHTATLIFLHGTGGAGSLNHMTNQFPSLKVIHPYSPILKYDMWHGSNPAPGGQQEQGWINVTGDVHELMESDVCPGNPPRTNYEEVTKSVHLDYPQLRRATSYIDEIIEQEIARGIPAEKIAIAGYSQGALLTLAVALTTKYKLGGFISLSGILPCHDKLLVTTKNLNKTTPILIINNSGDKWVPFWAGRKSYQILQDWGYNLEFKTYPNLGHTWKDEKLVEFLKKNILVRENPSQKDSSNLDKWNNIKKTLIVMSWVVGGVILLAFIWLLNRRKSKKFVVKNT